MKNNFAKILIVSILCLMTLCIAASAETVNLLPDESGRYDVTYEGGAGEYYAIVVVEGTYTEEQTPKITDANIIYISQETADANGNVTFADFKPKTETEGTVYIGGSDLQTAVLFGYLKTGTITVPANSTVFFVDGTTETYTEETKVEVPAEEGFIYVNTGYTAHTVYEVDANGIATKIDSLDNAVLGIDGASIRTKGVQGIRFPSSVDNDVKAFTVETNNYEITEYGFIVTAETTATGLKDSEYSLDMALVNNKKAIKGVAYNKADGTDLVSSLDESNNRTIFTAVAMNIPENSTALTDTIASRPYYILTDGTNEITIYGEITKRSIYNVAVAISNDTETDDYVNNQEYIDKIIGIVKSAG